MLVAAGSVQQQDRPAARARLEDVLEAEILRAHRGHQSTCAGSVGGWQDSSFPCPRDHRALRFTQLFVGLAALRHQLVAARDRRARARSLGRACTRASSVRPGSRSAPGRSSSESRSCSSGSRLREKPGLGTLANVVMVGGTIDLVLWLVPDAHGSVLRWGCCLVGVLVNGIATGMYIGAGLGPGPRDGLMTGLARRTGRSIRLVRTALEVTVLVLGWILGGTVGIGTVIYLLAIGPLAHIFVPLFRARPDGLPAR